MSKCLNYHDRPVSALLLVQTLPGGFLHLKSAMFKIIFFNQRFRYTVKSANGNNWTLNTALKLVELNGLFSFYMLNA